MDSVRGEMGVFEGSPGRRVFTHSIDLLKTGQYHLAERFVCWSVANGGPGLACLSPHAYSGLISQPATDPHDAVQDVTDDTLRQVVREVGIAHLS